MKVKEIIELALLFLDKEELLKYVPFGTSLISLIMVL